MTAHTRIITLRLTIENGEAAHSELHDMAAAALAQWLEDGLHPGAFTVHSVSNALTVLPPTPVDPLWHVSVAGLPCLDAEHVTDVIGYIIDVASNIQAEEPDG